MTIQPIKPYFTMGKIYTFKEVKDKQELEALFQLRYSIYEASANIALMNENQHCIDVDFYDICSNHFVLKWEEVNVGYIRVVLPKHELINRDVIEIGEKFGLINETEYFHQNKKAPFPFLNYMGTPQSHWDFYYELQNKNEQLIEASRLILHPDFRTIRTSKFLVECAIVLYVLIGNVQSHAIINCKEKDATFYKHYGFMPVANGETYLINGMNRMCLSLSLSLSSVPQKYHEKFEAMAEEYKHSGKIIGEL